MATDLEVCENEQVLSRDHCLEYCLSCRIFLCSSLRDNSKVQADVGRRLPEACVQPIGGSQYFSSLASNLTKKKNLKGKKMNIGLQGDAQKSLAHVIASYNFTKSHANAVELAEI